MIKLFKSLLGRKPGESESQSEMRRLATLLATEFKLYNSAALKEARGTPQLPDELGREVAKAYRTYAEQVGGSEEAEGIFCREFARVITPGDEHLVRFECGLPRLERVATLGQLLEVLWRSAALRASDSPR